MKNKLLTNFINKKDPILKEECHTKYKKYRNLLSTLFIQPLFHDRCFSFVLKTVKVVSKLDCSNYRPISLLSNIEKILEKLMYKRLYTFLNNNNIICNLQFGFRQQHSTSHALINILRISEKLLMMEI